MLVGLKEVGKFEQLLSFGCAMLPALPVPGLDSKLADGGCEVTVDVAKLPLPYPEIASVFEGPVKIRAEVKEKRFSLTIGNVSKPSAATPTKATSEFLAEDSNLSTWLSNIAIASALQKFWPMIQKQVPAEELEKIQMAVWVASHLNSVGFAVSIREDGVHGLLQIGTYAADTEEAYSAYQAAVLASIDTRENTFDAHHEKYPQGISAQASNSGSSIAAAAMLGWGGWLSVAASSKEDLSEEKAEIASPLTK